MSFTVSTLIDGVVEVEDEVFEDYSEAWLAWASRVRMDVSEAFGGFDAETRKRTLVRAASMFAAANTLTSDQFDLPQYEVTAEDNIDSWTWCWRITRN